MSPKCAMEEQSPIAMEGPTFLMLLSWDNVQWM